MRIFTLALMLGTMLVATIASGSQGSMPDLGKIGGITGWPSAAGNGIHAVRSLTGELGASASECRYGQFMANTAVPARYARWTCDSCQPVVAATNCLPFTEYEMAAPR